MHPDDQRKRIVDAIPELSGFRLSLIYQILSVLAEPVSFTRHPDSDLVSQGVLDDFGDVLRVHHSFSREPFSKDKFEYALDQVMASNGREAKLAPRGTRGFDITIASEKFSLKTEAAKAIKVNSLHISKFMELGGGDWGDNPDDLIGLRDQFLTNLDGIERILTLRALDKLNPYRYELVEIPRPLLAKARDGDLEMKLKSTQFPKPGYCYVRDAAGTLQFSLYFDGGGERKLQIKGLNKDLCRVHATWKFELPTSS